MDVGIFGASGYMGGEALRVLSEHPEFHVKWATSRSGKSAEFFHRNLYGSGIQLVKPEEVTDCDAVLFALPSGNAMEMAGQWLDRGAKVIDLGADFRLRNQGEWEEVYGKEHGNWALVEESVYGIPELHRDEIRSARVIANPGCFASAAILGLSPLLKNGFVEPQRLIVDGLSGTTGAGADLDTTMHHPEIGNNIVPYNVVDHRHTYEIEQELRTVSGDSVAVHFTPAYVPITRGILAIIHAFPVKEVSRSDLLELYRDFYNGEHFVRIFDAPKDPSSSWQFRPYPWVAAVSGTNFCHIGLDIDQKRNRIVVFSVLDSVGKGGSHAAVQNLNLMFGYDEALGVSRHGVHPY